MNRRRISIAGLMGCVSFAAVGFAALRAGTVFWFNALYTLSITGLLAATIAARVYRREAGTFWFGCVLVGWVFLWTGFGLRPLPSDQIPEGTVDGLINEYLLTTLFMKWVYNTVHVPNDLTQIGKYGNSLAIGHLLLMWVLAFAGGYFALVLRGILAKVTPAQQVSSQAWADRRPFRSTALAGASTVLVLFVLIAAFAFLHDPPGPYFPTPVPGLDASKVESYRQHLAAMREPSLSKLARNDPSAVAYRLLWIPQYGHPVAVRAVKTGETAQVHATVLDGHGDGDDGPGAVAIRRQVLLDRARWTALAARADESRFWSLPTETETTATTPGDSLVIEGITNGRHHVVVRNKGNAPEYDAFSQALLDASGLGYQPAWGGFR